MYRHEQTVRHRILRKFKAILRICCIKNIGISARYGQPSHRIVGTCGTNRVHKNLVKLVDNAGIISHRSSFTRHLVHGFKNDMFVIIFKTLCNMTPDSFILLFHRIKIICRNPKPSCLFRTVMMNINDNIHIHVHCIIHDVLYPAHPHLINGITVCIIYHGSPGHRYAYGIKAHIMQLLY